jgi:hypothetical protein
LDAIVGGIEAALELERELGVRFFECDRSLLSAPEIRRPATEPVTAPERRPAQMPQAAETVRPTSSEPVAAGGDRFDFVFLHDRRLSAAGEEMMKKIVAAMKRDERSAPVLVDPPLPPAKVYVVLGSFALRKFFPGLRGAPGQWLKAESGADVLVSNSPEFILRFGVETEAVKKIKQDMWRSLKTVVQRLAS